MCSTTKKLKTRWTVVAASVAICAAADATVVESRRHMRITSGKDVWPKLVYKSVPFNRKPSVR